MLTFNLIKDEFTGETKIEKRIRYTEKSNPKFWE